MKFQPKGAAFAAVALAALGLSGCAGSGRDASGSEADETSRLVTWSSPGDGEPMTLDAVVSGELALNAYNCYELGGVLLKAPPGSYANEDSSIHVPGLGNFSIGDKVSGGGGYLEVKQEDLSSEEAACSGDADVVHIWALAAG